MDRFKRIDRASGTVSYLTDNEVKGQVGEANLNMLRDDLEVITYRAIYNRVSELTEDF